MNIGIPKTTNNRIFSNKNLSPHQTKAYFSHMKKIHTIMKKILFLLLTVFSISCGLVSNSEEPTKLWLTDVNQALELSKETGKPIFAFFTGKEWCSWCKKLERQILSKEAFISYAKENLILLELDFPRGKRNLLQIGEET